jgi:hypothetical protein
VKGNLLLAARWLLVPVAGMAGVYLAMFLAMGVHEGLNSWCPGGEIVSGACSLSWVMWSAFAVGAVAAPVFAGLLSVWAAPSRGPRTIWSLLLVGLGYAALMFWRVGFAWLLIAAVSGTLTALWLRRRYPVQTG